MKPEMRVLVGVKLYNLSLCVKESCTDFCTQVILPIPSCFGTQFWPVLMNSSLNLALCRLMLVEITFIIFVHSAITIISFSL